MIYLNIKDLSRRRTWLTAEYFPNTHDSIPIDPDTLRACLYATETCDVRITFVKHKTHKAVFIDGVCVTSKGVTGHITSQQDWLVGREYLRKELHKITG